MSLLSISAEQLLGRYWWQTVHPADEQTLHDAFVNILRVSYSMHVHSFVKTQKLTGFLLLLFLSLQKFN